MDTAKSLGWHNNAKLATWTEKSLFDIREQIVPVKAVVAKWMKAKNKHSTFSPICRHCGKEAETVDHISAGCEKLNFTDHKKRHDQLATLVHHAICKKSGAECDSRAWMHKPAMRTTVGANTIKWDPTVKTLRKTPHNRPDIIWEKGKECVIIEIGCPLDRNVVETQDEKTKKYRDLETKIKQLRGEGTTTRTVPIVIGNTGMVTVDAERHLSELELDLSLETLQKTAAMQTVGMLNRHKLRKQ